MALAVAALRSSSDLPSFFWLRSRAACAFWTLDPFPMVEMLVAELLCGLARVCRGRASCCCVVADRVQIEMLYPMMSSM